MVKNGISPDGRIRPKGSDKPGGMPTDNTTDKLGKSKKKSQSTFLPLSAPAFTAGDFHCARRDLAPETYVKPYVFYVAFFEFAARHLAISP